MPSDLTEDDEACFDAIKQVWASKWSARATYSRRACDIPHKALHMAVLCQQVVAGDYAFVLHSSNPVSKDKDEVMGELCIGLGEALVGKCKKRMCAAMCQHRGECIGNVITAHSLGPGQRVKSQTLMF